MLPDVVRAQELAGLLDASVRSYAHSNRHAMHVRVRLARIPGCDSPVHVSRLRMVGQLRFRDPRRGLERTDIGDQDALAGASCGRWVMLQKLELRWIRRAHA